MIFVRIFIIKIIFISFLITSLSIKIGFANLLISNSEIISKQEPVSSRFHLVDHFNYENFLFRGKAPKDKKNKTFAYDRILNDIQSFFPFIDKNNSFLVDYNLMHHLIPKERKYSQWEQSFFENYSDQGVYIHWPISIGNKKNLNRHLDRIHNLLTHPQPEGKHLIIYLHCLAGCDRTGYVVSAYRMKYLEYFYEEAVEQSKKECGREMNSFYKQRLKSYCRYLKTHGHPVGVCPEKKVVLQNKK